ncbi:unnamed protein product [Cylicocyclus nassatus]|uniref:Calponin-homology (CH) domain-containing protein n=1 Tax=Cylicocyclus nassatus TaxID=53992 RepID=A0AA36H1K2_CYLNA|nr:unnamed protein product [Cylicocyclus nassatus]
MADDESGDPFAAERRKSVRFSSAREEFLFSPDTSRSISQSMHSASTVGDENLFRVPKFKRDKDMTAAAYANIGRNGQELRSAAHESVKMAISPGTQATESKREAKLRKLREMQQNRQSKSTWQKEGSFPTPKIDLARTERSFVEGSTKLDSSRLSGAQKVMHPPKFPYNVPEPRFSDISSIRPSDATFSVDQGGAGNIVCSTPLRHPPPAMGVPAAMIKSTASDSNFVPATRVSSTIKEMVLATDEDYLMTKDERTQHQMEAMAVWCAMILRSQYEDDEFDIGSTKQEANKMLQDLLAKSKTRRASSTTENSKPFKYADYLKKQKRDSIRESANRLFNSSQVPFLIRGAVSSKVFSVRADCCVYSDLRLQTTLLRLFLSFHPAWLHLGLETVYNTEIRVNEGEVFAQVISRFIVQRLFSDPKIMKNKKYAIGSGKLIVTDAGREALHSHFLLHTCLFCYFVETAKANSIIKHNPRMFAKSSSFKCMDDVFAELSREVLSGSGTPLNKAFAKMGFRPTYKQGFADDYNYTVKDFSDLTDGVILGKIIELVTGCPPGSLISRLRNPGGDRLRKIGNVKVCLQTACDRGVDLGAVKAEAITGANKEAILEVLWKLVGVYVGADEERNLRRASLALAHQNNKLNLGAVPDDVSGEQFVLHICKQIGSQLDLKIETLNDLRNGRLLAGAWRIYNPRAPDIRLYPGETLLVKVANAAETELDVPWGLHHSLGLFAHLYLSRLFSIRELHNAATRIQRAYRSYKFFKAIKHFIATHDQPTDTCNRALAGASMSAAEDRSVFATTYIVEDVNNRTEGPNAVCVLKEAPEATKEKTEYVKCRGGDELRSALSKLREEIEAGKLRSGEDREREAREALFTHLTIKLQALVRGFIARRRFRLLVEQKKAQLQEAALRERAATVIQAYARGYLARNRFRDMVLEKKAIKRAELEKRSAMIMQADSLGVVGRVCYRALLEKIRIEEKRKNEAARKIQRAFRKYQLRKLKRRERQELWTKMNKAATLIQSVFRMHLARKELHRLKKLKEFTERQEVKRKNWAAVVIQRWYRQTIAKRRYQRIQQDMRLKRDHMNRVVEQMKKVHAACRIQRAYRAHRLREQMRAERRKIWAKLENAAIGIQKYARGMLARKRYAELREMRQKELKNIIIVQSCVRGFLARRQVREMSAQRHSHRENDTVFEDTQENAPSTSLENAPSTSLECAPSTSTGYGEKHVIDLERLRRLQRRVRENERKQKCYSTLLEACERKLSEEDSSIIQESATEQPQTQTNFQYEPTSEDQTIAATKIQAWWRGCLVRAELREHLHRRRSYMIAYLGNVAAEQPEDVVDNIALDALPVHTKIHDAVEMLFNPKMYITKVGAFILNRVTALTPHLCAYFVVDAQGLAALLDFFGQKSTGRGPGTADILSILAEVFLRVLECREAVVEAEVNALLEDCAKSALHIFHAFYVYPQIVYLFGKAILAIHRRPEAAVYFDKAPFYMNYARRRFARFPHTDARRAILEEMINEMPY